MNDEKLTTDDIACLISGIDKPKAIQEKQAESEKYDKAFDDGYRNGYAQARFDYEQELCEDEYIKVPKKALKYRTAGMVAYNAEWLKNHFDIERAVICGVQEPILDKIRAEIEHEYKCLSNTRADETLELGECLGLKMSLKIIDKHIGGGNQNELLHRL